MYKTRDIVEEYNPYWNDLISLFSQGTFSTKLEPKYIVQQPENINRLIRSLVGHKN